MGLPRKPEAVSEFLDHHLTYLDDHTPFTPLLGFLSFDEETAELTLQHPRFSSVDDLIAVLLAELENPECDVEIVSCRHAACDQFLLRLSGRGRPQLDCQRCKLRRRHRKSEQPQKLRGAKFKRRRRR